jgi:hypothetical protein
MSATVEPVTENKPALDENTELPDARVLEDKTPEWARMSGISVYFVVTLGLLMITVFASRPLWPTDLWDHVNYGNWMLTQQTVPGTEPLLPLADGIPMVTSAWLAQVGLASLFNTAGFAGLQFAYGLLVVASLGIIAWGGVRLSGSTLFGFVALFAFLALNWQQFLVIRPQLIGVLLFSALAAWLLSVRSWHRAGWIALPLAFTVWANSHGSFAIGLTALAITGMAHAINVFTRTRSLRLALSNQRVVRLFLLTQLCAVSALINPNGLALFAEVLRVGQHPNIDSMFEWDPLTLRMRQGQVAAILGLILIVALRWSPRRLQMEEAMLLAFTAGMALWSSRMINWLAPVMALTLAAHGAAAWRHLRGTSRPRTKPATSGLWTVVNAGLCWVFFAFTTLGVQTVHGRSVPVERAVSPQTPLSATEFLNSAEGLPEGLAFCSAEWAGFLTSFGPDDFRPMVNLHVHVIPEEVWTHYQQLAAGPADWNGITDLYGINLVVTTKSRHDRLIRQIKKSAKWEPLFEDAQAVIFQRREPVHQIPSAAE